MSNLLHASASPAAEFQSHFGTPPGCQDLRAECERWEKLCGKLLAEREHLKAELAALQASRDRELQQVMRIMGEPFPYPTEESLIADIVPGQTLRELIDELERAGQAK